MIRKKISKLSKPLFAFVGAFFIGLCGISDAYTQTNFVSCVSGTSSNKTVVIPTAATVTGDATSLQANDEIAVFTPDGTLCAGINVWNSSNLSLTVWGEDTVPVPAPGIPAGSQMNFYVWRPATNELFQTTVQYGVGDNIFVGGSFAVADQLTLTMVDSTDYGDLLDGPYPSLIANNGARHVILPINDPNRIILGNGVTVEPNSQQVTGDTADDGVVPRPAVDWDNGTNGGHIDATVGGNGNGGWLCGWFDFGDHTGGVPDGTFDSFFSQAATAGLNQIDFDVPANTFLADGNPGGQSVPMQMRIRLFASNPGNCELTGGFTGQAINGEVEDYGWAGSPTAITLQNLTTRDLPDMLWITVASAIVFIIIAIFFLRQRARRSVL